MYPYPDLPTLMNSLHRWENIGYVSLVLVSVLSIGQAILSTGLVKHQLWMKTVGRVFACLLIPSLLFQVYTQVGTINAGGLLISFQNEKAAQIEAETERLRVAASQRQLAQCDKLTSEIQHMPRGTYIHPEVAIEYGEGSAEALLFAIQVKNCFQQMHWRAVMHRVSFRDWLPISNYIGGTREIEVKAMAAAFQGAGVRVDLYAPVASTIDGYRMRDDPRDGEPGVVFPTDFTILVGARPIL